MVSASDLKGIMTMMPAFTKTDGDRIDATDTVDTDELTRTVDKIIRDGGGEEDGLKFVSGFVFWASSSPSPTRNS